MPFSKNGLFFNPLNCKLFLAVIANIFSILIKSYLWQDGGQHQKKSGEYAAGAGDQLTPSLTFKPYPEKDGVFVYLDDTWGG